MGRLLRLAALSVVLASLLVSSRATNAESASVSKAPGSGFDHAVWPVRVGPTGRYLVDHRGRPFLIVGDSAQALIVKLSLRDADRYLTNRRVAGFNSIWVNLLCNAYTGGRADGRTYAGIPPFRTPGDLSTPNSRYFQRVDAMIRLAAQHGITVFLDPIETGGWLGVLEKNGIAKDYRFGRYLGLRYRSFPNIVWFNGNDFQQWADPEEDATALAVAHGIRATDPNHIHTVELNYTSSGSLDDPRWKPIIELNASYTYHPTYAQVLRDYNRVDHLPTFMVEANYEFDDIDYAGSQTLRRQEYWALLSGAAGQFFGNSYIWPFATGWRSKLNTPGVAQLGYVTKLFKAVAWQELVPDQSHAVVVGGYGSFSAYGNVNASDYVTAARTPNGKLAIAYLPVLRTVTVDLAELSGPVRARWYDPASGRFSRVRGSPFPNTGIRRFTPAGRNSDGDSDWVLVLTTVA
jgi:Protein of unknown function (DUF4038)/Putative collagen-binding domain of a collagenase